MLYQAEPLPDVYGRFVEFRCVQCRNYQKNYSILSDLVLLSSVALANDLEVTKRDRRSIVWIWLRTGLFALDVRDRF